MNKVIGIQTARAGSKSVPNKNITVVKGMPMYKHNLNGMTGCKLVDKVIITTDIDEIFQESHPKLSILRRSSALSGDSASHSETIREALFKYENDNEEYFDIVVVTLGNSMSCNAHDLESAILKLTSSEDLSSVISVSKFNMFNPFRAYVKDEDNCLTTFIPQNEICSRSKDSINDKNSAGDIYYFNGGFWVIRREALIEEDGLLPFPWLGSNIGYFEQKTEMEIDDHWQLNYLANR